MPQITFDFELKPEENDLLASILECKNPMGKSTKVRLRGLRQR